MQVCPTTLLFRNGQTLLIYLQQSQCISHIANLHISNGKCRQFYNRPILAIETFHHILIFHWNNTETKPILARSSTGGKERKCVSLLIASITVQRHRLFSHICMACWLIWLGEPPTAIVKKECFYFAPVTCLNCHNIFHICYTCRLSLVHFFNVSRNMIKCLLFFTR